MKCSCIQKWNFLTELLPDWDTPLKTCALVFTFNQQGQCVVFVCLFVSLFWSITFPL